MCLFLREHQDLSTFISFESASSRALSIDSLIKTLMTDSSCHLTMGKTDTKISFLPTE